MAIEEVCPSCGVKLRLPASGVGRCPKCKTVVRVPAAEAAEAPAASAQAAVLREISPEDEVGGSGESGFAAKPASSEGVPAPPPLPRRAGRARQRVPAIDIGNPRPRPSRVVPVTLLALALVVSFSLVVWSFVYLIVKAREHGAGAAPIVMPMR